MTERTGDAIRPQHVVLVRLDQCGGGQPNRALFVRRIPCGGSENLGRWLAFNPWEKV